MDCLWPKPTLPALFVVYVTPINVSSTKLFIVNQCVSNSPSKIRPMARVEYKGQACLHFVEAKPIAAGRAGRGR